MQYLENRILSLFSNGISGEYVPFGRILTLIDEDSAIDAEMLDSALRSLQERGMICEVNTPARGYRIK